MSRQLNSIRERLIGLRPATLPARLPFRSQVAALLGRWVSCENTPQEIRAHPVVQRLIRSGVVLACAGPSLRSVDVRSPGLPIAAVSSAIWNEQLQRPDVWFLADRPAWIHGPRSRGLWNDPGVLKLAPSYCTYWRTGASVLRPAVNLRKQEKAAIAAGRQPFDGALPLLRRPNKTITFAVQWLVYVGVQKIILCGCDLAAGGDPASQYGHDRILDAKARDVHAKMLAVERQYLQEWLPRVSNMGVDIRAWSPGSIIEKWIPTYEPGASN